MLNYFFLLSLNLRQLDFKICSLPTFSRESYYKECFEIASRETKVYPKFPHENYNLKVLNHYHNHLNCRVLPESKYAFIFCIYFYPFIHLFPTMIISYEILISNFHLFLEVNLF